MSALFNCLMNRSRSEGIAEKPKPEKRTISFQLSISFSAKRQHQSSSIGPTPFECGVEESPLCTVKFIFGKVNVV